MATRELRRNPALYETFFKATEGEFVDMIANTNLMSQDDIWGDNYTLQSTADAYGIRLEIIVSWDTTDDPGAYIVNVDPEKRLIDRC